MESSLCLSWHYWHRANSANPLEYNGFALFMPSVPLLPNPHGRTPILRHYVQSSPHLFDRSSMAKQNLSHRANVICDGSPSRIRRVRRISFGMTIRPRSSIRLTIPVAFIYCSSTLCVRNHIAIVCKQWGIMRMEGKEGKGRKRKGACRNLSGRIWCIFQKLKLFYVSGYGIIGYRDRFKIWAQRGRA